MRNIIFDLGGVIFEWNSDLILERFYSDLDVRVAVKAGLFQHTDWLQMDRGMLTCRSLSRLRLVRSATARRSLGMRS
jgi:FMN phosphatase YigB (HAD superfamily)